MTFALEISFISSCFVFPNGCISFQNELDNEQEQHQLNDIQIIHHSLSVSFASSLTVPLIVLLVEFVGFQISHFDLFNFQLYWIFQKAFRLFYFHSRHQIQVKQKKN